MADRLTASLQESVLTLLATNDKEGRVAAGLVKAAHFEEPYLDVAARVLQFHKQHGHAPGKAHLDDLVDDILNSPKHKKFKSTQFVLQGVLMQADGLNAPYILTRVNEFAKRQTIKAAVLDAAERYTQGDVPGQDLIADVEKILHRGLKFRDEGMDAGLFFGNKKESLSFMDFARSDSISIDIKELDARGINPTPGEMLLLMGPKGSGKSWFCVHCAKTAMMQQKRVVHITLEMSKERSAQRYHQAFHALSLRKERYALSELRFNRRGRLVDIRDITRKPRMSLSDPQVRKFLSKQIDEHGLMFDKLIIKQFPTRSLTMDKLESYLDFLELRHGFIPHLLIIDYPDLMWMDKRDLRVSIMNTYEELRGLLQKRNMAGVFPTQTNRKGWDATTVKASMIGEDATKMNTADMALIFSSTPEEKKRGLARLYVEKNRYDEDQFTVLITQSYATGQYVLQSTRMTDKYFKLIDPRKDRDDDDDE